MATYIRDGGGKLVEVWGNTVIVPGEKFYLQSLKGLYEVKMCSIVNRSLNVNVVPAEISNDDSFSTDN